MSTKINPGKNRIVVEKHDAEKMKGSIVLPDVAQEAPSEGVVIAAGYRTDFCPFIDKDGNQQPRYVATPVQWEVGDTVVFGKYSGTRFEVDGKELLVMNEDEVICSVERSIEVVSA